jgi:hypothetical protein
MRALELIGPSPKAAWRAYHHHLNYTRNREDELRDSAGVRLAAGFSFHPDPEVYFDSNPVLELTHLEGRFDFLTNVPLDQICAVVADVMGVETAAIKGKGKQGIVSKARGAFIYIARKTGWRPVDLKNQLGFSPGTIAHHLSRNYEVPDSREMKDIIDALRNSFEGKNPGT